MELDPADPRPVYERIADELRRSITNGVIKLGDQLPSLAEIKSRYDVSTMTAREAIKVLSTEGLVVVRQGAGAFVIGTAVKTGTSESPTGLVQQLHRIENLLGDLDSRVAALEQVVSHRETSQSPQDGPHDR
ncbi:GntR family transcriptional regulator [Kibdelosporangium philippinense]|uniref:GntR family transcriptional regulator n=1 Tax=Kibdelosporangium philippinense TaxID=211113 RepID=A0ABS8ZFY6_9PSEU|nr:GntR family transcriptional regulator [Kibdelosporangium philippinense]MCE7006736.1 GntR family transcriptional regulator [Kibdelosporangium philippinense]